MAANRIIAGGAGRRGHGGAARRAASRRRLAVAAPLAVALAALAGCGGGGGSSGGSSSTAPTAGAGTATPAGTARNVSTPTPSAEQSADAALLDEVLSRQEAAVEAFAKIARALPPRLARMTLYFRAQEQEHVDSLLKALRGLESPAEPSPEPIDLGELEDTRERLDFLYEVESGTIDEELSAISKLEASWPRSLLASTVANQAQHLSLLRSALGAGPLETIPVPFENGTAPPPEAVDGPAR